MALLPTVQVLAGFQNLDQNLQDGTFETGVTGWTPTGGSSTFTSSTVQAHSGTHSGLLTVAGSPSTVFLRNALSFVTPGARYDATMWVFSDVAAVRADIDWFDISTSFISTTSVSYTVTIHAWTPVSVTGVAPVNATQAHAGPTLTGSPANGTLLYLDDFRGPITGPGAWTDISLFVRSFTVSRPSTRLQGPLWQYQAGTASVTLKNGDGRFDPDNLTGPYVSPATLTAATVSSELTSWTAPANLFGASVDPHCWAAGGFTSSGASGGGGGGEYAEEPFLPATAGQVFTTQTGQGGNGFARNTIFGTVTAHGGGASPGSSGAGGGTGSTNTIHFDGASGGATNGGNVGGGGGSSAGPNQSGNRGTAGDIPSGQDPAPGGLPVLGGGQGGMGGDATLTATPGLFPGGGAGGPGNNTFDAGQSGGNGLIQVLYRVATGTPVSQIGPGVPIQVLATWAGTTYPLFTGTSDGWTDTGINNPRYSETVLTATDGFEYLSNVQLPAVPALIIPEDSGARVTRILNAAGWPAAARSITTGDSVQQGPVFGSDALSLLQLTADTESGEVYVNGAGQVVFRHRQAILEDTRSTTPQGMFGDRPGTSHTAGTELALAAIGRADDNTTIANDIQITVPVYFSDPSPAMQEVQDLPSQSVNGVRSYARSDLLLISDQIAYEYAAWILALSKGSEDRFDKVTVNPRRDAADLFPQALAREIGDRVEVWRTPPGVTRFSKDVIIRGIQHDFDASGQAWLTTWTLQNAAKYDQILILDSATKGLLDVNTIGY